MLHNRYWALTIAVAGAVLLPVTGLGAVELGLGVMPPPLDDGALGAVTLAPHLTIGLGGLDLSLDAWMSPTSEVFVLMPFLQLSLQLDGLRLYGGIAPVMLGGFGGFTFVSPLLGFAAKAGGGLSVFQTFGVYGELVFGISPLFANPVSSVSSVVGLSVGF